MHTTEPFSTLLDAASLRHQLTAAVHQYAAQYADRSAAQESSGNAESLALPHLRRVPLDLHAEIDALLHPSTLLIDSPRRIVPEQLRSYVHGSAVPRLIFPDKAVHPATLRSLHPIFLVAETQSAMAGYRPGALVLVLFPGASPPHYVLQTVLEKQSASRLHLAYGDPRYDVRHRVQLMDPVLVYVAPSTLVPELRAQHTRVARDLYGPSIGAFPHDGGAITEHLYTTESESVTPNLAWGHDTLAHTCSLHDISLGGVCLGLPPAWQTETLRSRLLYLDIPLPIARPVRPEAEGLALRLQLFGLIRSVRGTPARGTLHLRFLRRLPAELDARFAALA